MEKTPRLERLLSKWREQLSDEDRAYLQDLLDNPSEETDWATHMIKRRLAGKPTTNCGMTWEDVEETDEILRELGMI